VTDSPESASDAAPAGELRRDALTGEWVNVVGHRQGRPNLPSDRCPFCVGGLEAPEPYDVRWFPNRWPALAPGAPIDFADGTAAHPAAGASEVVLFSPAHDESLASLPVEQVRRVVDLWAERTTALLARPEVEYVLVFENRGREVGATIPSLAALDDAARDDLARLLIDALGRYDRLWPEAGGADRFPYLLWFHQAPASGGDAWHVHAHVAPPLRARGVPRFVASGELGSGTLSNPVVPEDAARALRDA
jgi:galactose-1-phosphate uridylyltransferase